MNGEVISAATVTGAATIVAASAAFISALGAAAFAFLASWLNNKTAKSNAILQAKIAQRLKHAEFRQKWIDDLRKSMIDFQVAVFDREKNSSASDVLRHAGEILLRFNPADQRYKDLRICTDEMLSTDKKKDPENWTKNHANFLKISQKILKAEWEVLKIDLHEISHVDKKG